MTGPGPVETAPKAVDPMPGPRGWKIGAGTASRSSLILAGVLILALLLAGLTVHGFLTRDNILVVLRAAAVTGIVAACATSLTLSGTFFSLSLAPTAIFSGIIFALLMQAGTGLVVAAIGGMATGAAIGAIQGVVVAAGANPIITTLGAGALLIGVAGPIAGSKPVYVPETAAVTWLGTGTPLGVPTLTWVLLIVTVLAWVGGARTRLGRETILTGANRPAAVASGISVGKVVVAAFVLAALGCAIVGIFQAAQFDRVTLRDFGTLNFDVIAAILVGGCAANGGEGSPFRSALGAIFIALITNYMILRGWSSGVQLAVEGGVVVIAVVGFHLMRRSRTVTA
jgi:ribose transport system permease protein